MILINYLTIIFNIYNIKFFIYKTVEYMLRKSKLSKFLKRILKLFKLGLFKSGVSKQTLLSDFSYLLVHVVVVDYSVCHLLHVLFPSFPLSFKPHSAQNLLFFLKILVHFNYHLKSFPFDVLVPGPSSHIALILNKSRI